MNDTDRWDALQDGAMISTHAFREALPCSPGSSVGPCPLDRLLSATEGQSNSRAFTPYALTVSGLKDTAPELTSGVPLSITPGQRFSLAHGCIGILPQR